MDEKDRGELLTAFRRLEPDDFLKKACAILVDVSEKGNELYMVEDLSICNAWYYDGKGYYEEGYSLLYDLPFANVVIGDDYFRDGYFLRYKCPSTNNVYLKGIDPKIGDKKNADLAQAWSFGLTLEEYRRLEAEA